MFIVTTDITGTSVAINPDLVQGIIDANTSPQGALVKTETENFVLAGTVAAAATLLGAGRFLVTTDIGGDACAINASRVQGLSPLPTTPAGVLVKSITENFVLAGTPASVAAALAAVLQQAPGSLPLIFGITGTTGAISVKNQIAGNYGVAVSRSSAGVYVVTFTTSLGVLGTWEPSATILQNAAREASFALSTGLTFQINTYDAATPSAADADMLVKVVFGGPLASP